MEVDPNGNPKGGSVGTVEKEIKTNEQLQRYGVFGTWDELGNFIPARAHLGTTRGIAGFAGFAWTACIEEEEGEEENDAS